MIIGGEKEIFLFIQMTYPENSFIIYIECDFHEDIAYG